MTEDGLSTFQPRTYSCKHIYAVCLFLLFSMDSRTFLKFLRWRECVMIQIGLTPVDLQPKPIKWYSHCNTILHLMKILYLKQWENYLYPVLEWERESAHSRNEYVIRNLRRALNLPFYFICGDYETRKRNWGREGEWCSWCH